MKKQYISPTAEIVCFAATEEIADGPKTWQWSSTLQNYWGKTKEQTASGAALWYDLPLDEFAE